MKLPEHFWDVTQKPTRAVIIGYAEAYARRALEGAIYTTSLKCLRDHFAAKAMELVTDNNISVTTAARLLGIKESEYNYHIHWAMLVAQKAYAQADAMLAEREKT